MFIIMILIQCQSFVHTRVTRIVHIRYSICFLGDKHSGLRARTPTHTNILIHVHSEITGCSIRVYEVSQTRQPYNDLQVMKPYKKKQLK